MEGAIDSTFDKLHLQIRNIFHDTYTGTPYTVWVGNLELTSSCPRRLLGAVAAVRRRSRVSHRRRRVGRRRGVGRRWVRLRPLRLPHRHARRGELARYGRVVVHPLEVDVGRDRARRSGAGQDGRRGEDAALEHDAAVVVVAAAVAAPPACREAPRPAPVQRRAVEEHRRRHRHQHPDEARHLGKSDRWSSDTQLSGGARRHARNGGHHCEFTACGYSSSLPRDDRQQLIRIQTSQS